ncbi:MAG: hypothetical protein IKC69_02510 [Clostridia bacterium]|nr:hypothetical protein [Clostridia bacterium]
MKRILRVLLFILLSAALFFLPVHAAQEDALREFSGVEDLDALLPEGIEKSDIDSFLEDPSPSSTIKQVGDGILDAVSFGLGKSLGLFTGLLVLVLASVLFDRFRKSFGDGVQSAFDLFFLLTAAIFSFSHLSVAFQMTSKAVQALNTFTLGLLPVTTVLLTLSGAVESAALQSAYTGFVVQAIGAFVSSTLLPLIRTLFCFSFLEGMEEKGVGGILSFFHKTGKRILVFFFSTVSAILAIKNVFATAKDSLALRSVRFAAGSFVPIVGGALGESSRNLSAAFTLIKGECGGIALGVILYLLLRPILTLAIQKAFLALASGVGEMLEESRCRRFLTALAKVLDLMMALLIAQGAFLIFAIVLFLKTKGGLG